MNCHSNIQRALLKKVVLLSFLTNDLLQVFFYTFISNNYYNIVYK